MIQSSAKMNLIRSKSGILWLCLALVAVCAMSASAQSGRRQPKAPPAAPVPTPTPDPTPEPKKDDQQKSDLSFIIGADRYMNMNGFPLSYSDAVMAGCAGQIGRASCRER